MKHVVYFLILGASLLIFSCKNDTASKEPEVKSPPTETTKIDEGVIEDISFRTKEIMIAFNDYIALKNALVNTNSETALKEAVRLKNSLASVTNVSKKAAIVADEIIQAKDIDEQRMRFSDLTLFIEEMVKGDVLEGAILKQYCPMAFNNRGGYWLSNSKEIRNPYFGDKMLKCGRVAEEIN